MTRTPPSESSDQDAQSRRARLGARRHRRMRITAALVVIVVAGAIAVAAYALNTNDNEAHAAGPAVAKPGSFGARGTLVAPVTPKGVSLRALSHADPLKLWVGGDSLAGSFGPALGDQVGATGVVQTTIDYKVSSGLWSNDIRNWDERATEQMAAQNPDAVVFIIGANDAPIVNRVDANHDGVPDWQAEYRLKVDRMMDLLVGPTHRTVFWLGPPTLGTENMDSGAKEIGEVMRTEAAKRAPDVEYLDTYKLFSTPDGTFSRRILDENGKEILARISDGVHFTEDGAQYLARAVFSLIDARWKLTKQADPSVPIGWALADGSGESVPGFHSAPRSRYQPRHTQSNSPTTSGSNSDTTFSSQTTTPVTDSPTTVSQTTTPVTTPHTTPTTSAPVTTAPGPPTSAKSADPKTPAATS